MNNCLNCQQHITLDQLKVRYNGPWQVEKLGIIDGSHTYKISQAPSYYCKKCDYPIN